MTMIERVALALFDRLSAGDGCGWSETNENERESYRADARAAIEALRSPAAEILAASINQERWNAIIDAMLTEAPKP